MIEKIIGSKIHKLTLDSAHVFFARAGAVDFELGERVISNYRRKKLQRLRRNRDVCLLSELLLIYGLGKLGEDITLPLEIAVSENGKPQALESDWNFNISHTEDISVVAISKDVVGVDIENVNRESRAIEKYLTDAEKQLKEPLSYIWTRKEAVAKADGRGISMGIERIDTADDAVKVDDINYRLFTVFLDGFYLSVALR